ncbi:MAG TPA: hypothetical protein VGV93_01965 [Acidimicrobiales bacterium]|nr:hypothetical protein [Acidimicrobiales bacterium]
MRRALLVSVGLAGCSLLVVPPAPSYDPWMWLRWGEELTAGQLSTVQGPAFKPLPVAVCALLAPLGPAAPWLWVLVARIAAVMAVVLAFRLGRRLANGSLPAGILAATGVALCGSYADLAAAGAAEGLVVALALAGAEAWRTGRPRWALACGVGAALVRVETWPFLLVAGVRYWQRRPHDRGLLVAGALLVPAAWFVPEVFGSRDLLRSVHRAQIPQSGQPALADFPALASFRAAVALPLWTLWAGVTVAVGTALTRRDQTARTVLGPAAIGLAWMGLVAAMARAGFSGEPRYALPGAALVAVSGAAGLVMASRRLLRWPAAASGLAALLVVLAAMPRIDDLAGLRTSQAYQWELQSELPTAVASLGGRSAVLACGRPYVGPLRGPLLAYHLDVAKHVVDPDRRPEAPGVVFRSALHPGGVPAPSVPAGFRPVEQVGPWQVYTAC